jgi:hypothetical protein
MHILFVLWDTTFIIVVLLWDFVVMCKMNIIFAENLFSTCHYHGPMAIAKLKGLRLTPIGLPNGIAILATRRERGGGLPQWLRSLTCHFAGTNGRATHVHALTPKHKWQLRLAMLLESPKK